MIKIFHHPIPENLNDQSKLDDLINNLNIDQKKSIATDYAATLSIEDTTQSTWLAFMEVEDHADGNGVSSLWITKGMGVFYQEGFATKVNSGDIIIFDDKKDHGFSSTEICIGLNITWGEMEPTEKELMDKINGSISKNPLENSRLLEAVEVKSLVDKNEEKFKLK